MGEWVLSRDFPDGSRSDVHIRALPAVLQDRSEVWTATVTLGSTNEGRGVDLGVFAGVLGWPLRPQFRKSDLTLKAIRRHREQSWAEAARGSPDNEGAFGATLPVGRFCPRSAPEQG